jgi:hypothetical protein
MSRYINLYDAALSRQRPWLTAANLVLATGALALALLAWGAWLHTQVGALSTEAADLASRTQSAREQSVALASELARRKPDPKLEQELVVLDELLGVRQGILSELGQGLASASGGYAEYLRGMARQSVAGLWLTGFTVTAGGSGMEIRGRTLDPALLPEYIRRLNGEKAFRGHRFAALDVATPAPPKSTGQAPAVGAAPAARQAPPFLEFALVPEQSADPASGRPE